MSLCCDKDFGELRVLACLAQWSHTAADILWSVATRGSGGTSYVADRRIFAQPLLLALV
jgi:hypothetical protein